MAISLNINYSLFIYRLIDNDKIQMFSTKEKSSEQCNQVGTLLDLKHADKAFQRSWIGMAKKGDKG
jgi:hypothetical protein